MKNFLKHIRTYIFRGLLAVIPIILCFFVIKLLYELIDRQVMNFLNQFIEVRHIPFLGILLVLVSLYLIGLVVGNFFGRQAFRFIEGIIERIPFIKAVYGVGKQLSESLAVTGEEKKAFKKAVLVHLEHSHLWAPAFVTGEIFDQKTQEKLLMVLVPTAPTPASGFVFAVKPSQVIDPGWTIEECLKALVSVGIITPKEIKK